MRFVLNPRTHSRRSQGMLWFNSRGFAEVKMSYTKFFAPEERVQYEQSVSFDKDWTREESAFAMAEGWDLFKAERVEIQRDDESMRFPGDEAARDYVAKRAEEGSQLHAKAWALHVRGRMT